MIDVSSHDVYKVVWRDACGALWSACVRAPQYRVPYEQGKWSFPRVRGTFLSAFADIEQAVGWAKLTNLTAPPDGGRYEVWLGLGRNFGTVPDTLYDPFKLEALSPIEIVRLWRSSGVYVEEDRRIIPPLKSVCCKKLKLVRRIYPA